jgi:O-6-methylguanine DNA methyltransferase
MMKEQILPALPIVGFLKLRISEERELHHIDVVNHGSTVELSPFALYCYREFWNYLSGQSPRIDIPVGLSHLGNFQRRVLEEMQKIPYGKVKTYKEIAEALGSKAYQAVGSACGKNPLMLIYPCHRVVASNGVGGFAHGLEMKLTLLELESKSLFPLSQKARVPKHALLVDRSGH